MNGKLWKPLALTVIPILLVTIIGMMGFYVKEWVAIRVAIEGIETEIRFHLGGP